MNIQISVTGFAGSRPPKVEWPEGWPVPRVGDEVSISPGVILHVRHVEWNPKGDLDHKDPYVYVVIGPRVSIRPGY